MKDCKLRTELADYLKNCVTNDGIDNDGKFSESVLTAVRIIEDICDYVEKHGDIALSVGGEWMYQSDEGQVDALELVAEMLSDLEDYAEEKYE